MTKAPTVLKPAEVAALLRVDVRTIGNWARAGKLRSSRTFGGHRRFLLTDVRKVADELGIPLEEAS